MDANFGFLARQLLLSELHGSSSDVPGGIEVVTAKGTWLGLWNAAATGDIEKLLVEAQQRTEAAGQSLCGAVVLSQHGASDAWNEIADALYIYGLPEVAGPESVMVLANPPHPKPRGLRFLPLSESPGACTLTVAALEAAAELTGPAWGADLQSTCELLDVQCAWHDTEIAGVVGTFSAGLAARIALLHIEPSWRERELAQAMVEHIAQDAQAAGKLLICAWAKKSGLLRFALGEGGFVEQVTARYFGAG